MIQVKTQLGTLTREEQQEIQQELSLAKGMLKFALEWCEADASNEDGYPTQEMMDNRVMVLKETLNGPARGE